jgi:glyceraldehyde 3-phosphate dehydrogenase
MIPTKTGAASAIGEVIPEMKGKLDGLAVRVPVINTSLVDFTFSTKSDTTVEEVNTILSAAAEQQLAGVLAVNTLPLVSTDFNHHPASSVFDSTQTKVIGNTVKVLAWYDNEWGFSNRMLDNAKVIVALDTAKETAVAS